MMRSSAERTPLLGNHSALELADEPTRPVQESTRATPDAGPSLSLAERVRAYEIGLIREALAQAGGNQSEAARLLSVPRRTLAHKVLSYGLLRSRRPARAPAPQEGAD